MDILKQKWKKNLVSRTWQRCTRLGHIRRMTTSAQNSSSSNNQVLSKSKSWNSGDPTYYEVVAAQPQTTNKGCFSVYVGPNRQRFVVKAEFANHPLFRMLLDDAETEYGGYTSEGPISLPCDVELFYKVLADMEFYNHFDHHYDDDVPPLGLGCGGFIMSPLARRRRSLPTLGGGGRGGGYNLLSPSRSSLLKLNNAAW